MRPRLAALSLLALLLTGCSGGGTTTAAAPTPSPGPTGPVTAGALRARLLQPADLPGLGVQKVFASAALTTASTPQLALCRPAPAQAPHEVANVLTEPARPGSVTVFEVLSVFADEAGAQAAFADAQRAVRACPRYTAAGHVFTLQGVSSPAVRGADQTLAYRLTTPGVVGGDVRTLARAGRTLLLVSGYGAPPAGQTLLAYQAAVMAKAVARAGAAAG